MNSIGATLGTLSPLPAISAPPVQGAAAETEAAALHLEPRDVTIAQPQSLASSAAPVPLAVNREDHEWSKGAKTAAIVAGVVGGAVVAGAVAYGVAIGGTNVGALLLNGIYREPLPRLIGFSQLLDVSNAALLAAPVAGAIGGGIVGGIAAHKKEEHPTSSVPGSGLAHNETGSQASPLETLGYTWKAVKTQFRGAGEKVHAELEGVHHAESLGEAVSSGARAGYAFGSRMGNVGGRVMGIAQGICLGALLAGLPFTFAPLTAIPLGFLGAWGASEVMSKVGGVAGGAVAGAGGAVAAAVSHGIHKATGQDKEA